MKKDISDRLIKIAAKLPICMEERPDELLMLGKELLLTPLAFAVTDPAAYYPVEIPKFVAVNHQTKLMEIWKEEGWPGVDVYCLTILKQAGLLKGVNVLEELEKKNRVKLGNIK